VINQLMRRRALQVRQVREGHHHQVQGVAGHPQVQIGIKEQSHQVRIGILVQQERQVQDLNHGWIGVQEQEDHQEQVRPRVRIGNPIRPVQQHLQAQVHGLHQRQVQIHGIHLRVVQDHERRSEVDVGRKERGDSHQEKERREMD